MLSDQELWKEEDKEAVTLQEAVMQQQIKRQKQPLKEQRELFSKFRASESGLINKVLLADSFTQDVAHYPNWELANFRVIHTGLGSMSELRGNWMPARLTPSDIGLQLRSLILRSRATLALKSIACEVRLDVRLAGTASLWVISRATSLSDPGGAVCKVDKERDSQRVFLAFGAYVGTHREFRFFKQQEMPGSRLDTPAAQDYVDLSLTLVDNGDETVFVKAVTGITSSLSFVCNKFIPKLIDCPLMVAGSGESVLLQAVRIKQRKRGEAFSHKSAHTQCCLLV